jgi:APA family basic amino acid/polyamine antiporter
MASLPWRTWERLLIWLGIGLFLYFIYGYRNSRLNAKQ